MSFLIHYLRIIPRAFENAFRTVKAVRWKSYIAMTTILIGSLAITTTFTISQNVDGYVEYLIDQDGGPRVTAYNFDQKVYFNQKDLDQFKNISAVKNVFSMEEANEAFRLKDKNSTFKILAVTKENYKQLSYKMIEGNFFGPLDFVDVRQNIVVSPEAINKLGMILPIGKSLNIKVKGSGEIKARIIGIARPTGNEYDQGLVWIPFPVFKDVTGKKHLSVMHILSKGTDWMNWLENFSSTSFQQKFGSNIWVLNPLQKFIEQKNQLGAFIQMGYILGFLALIAGSIGSTSVMIFNVNLRRREIGLYKAMGFTPGIILMQFTFETLVLSLIGGLIGALSGSVFGLIISGDMFPVAHISIVGLFLGLGSALCTGMLFGLIPALMAARLDPVKALQG